MAGHERIVKLLLKREDLNPDSLDHGGETAFVLAASRGYAGVAQLLSEPKPSLQSYRYWK